MKKLILTFIVCQLVLAFASCGFTYPDGDSYSVGEASIDASSVKSIDIVWSAGSVEIVAEDTDKISFSESSPKELDEGASLHYLLKNGKLSIKFVKSGYTTVHLVKTLKVVVPRSLVLDSLDISTASADVFAEGVCANEFITDTASGNMTINSAGKTDKVKADTASGVMKFNFGNIGAFSSDSASGDLTLCAESIENVKADSSSGNVKIDVSKEISSCEVETASGDVTIDVSGKMSSCEVETASGEFECEFPTIRKGETYICGSGENVFEIETASGDITFKKKK